MTDEAEPATGPPGHYRRQVVRNTLTVALTNGWAIVLSVVALPLMLHGLGAVAFGTWVLLQTFSATNGWLSLGDLGLGIATTRRVAEGASTDDQQTIGEATGTSLVVIVVLGTVFALVLGVAGRSFLPKLFSTPAYLVPATQFAAVCLGIQVLLELLCGQVVACLDGLHRIDQGRLVDAGRRTLVVGSGALTALAGGGLRGVAAVTVVATLLATLFGAAVLARALHGASLHVKVAVARQLLHYGRRIVLVNGAGVLHRSMDRLVVGVILGPAAVSLVEIATQVQNGVLVLLNASSYAVTSSAAWVNARQSLTRLQELFLRGTKYSCLLAWPLCALVSVLARPLVDVWLGTRYASAAGLIALALAYVATQAPLANGSNLLLGIGKAESVLRPAALAVVVNLGATIVLVHLYGVAGAFLGTIVSSVVLSPLLLRACLQATSVGLGRFATASLRPAVLPAVAATAGAVVFRLSGLRPLPTLLLGAALGGLASLGVMMRWSLDGHERAELIRAVRSEVR